MAADWNMAWSKLDFFNMGSMVFAGAVNRKVNRRSGN